MHLSIFYHRHLRDRWGEWFLFSASKSMTPISAATSHFSTRSCKYCLLSILIHFLTFCISFCVFSLHIVLFLLLFKSAFFYFSLVFFKSSFMIYSCFMCSFPFFPRTYMHDLFWMLLTWCQQSSVLSLSANCCMTLYLLDIDYKAFLGVFISGIFYIVLPTMFRRFAFLVTWRDVIIMTWMGSSSWHGGMSHHDMEDVIIMA